MNNGTPSTEIVSATDSIYCPIHVLQCCALSGRGIMRCEPIARKGKRMFSRYHAFEFGLTRPCRRPRGPDLARHLHAAAQSRLLRPADMTEEKRRNYESIALGSLDALPWPDPGLDRDPGRRGRTSWQSPPEAAIVERVSQRNGQANDRRPIPIAERRLPRVLA
jgi:hypothetical protein